jgi:lysophospholipase L1-like esterase
MADENEEVRPCDLTETREEFYDDDVFIVDSRRHNTAKMPAKDKLPQNVLAGRIAPAFIPSDKPNPTTTVAGRMYMYNGSLYMANEVYQGPWDARKFTKKNVNDLLDLILTDLDSISLFSDKFKNLLLKDIPLSPFANSPTSLNLPALVQGGWYAAEKRDNSKRLRIDVRIPLFEHCIYELSVQSGYKVNALLVDIDESGNFIFTGSAVEPDLSITITGGDHDFAEIMVRKEDDTQDISTSEIDDIGLEASVTYVKYDIAPYPKRISSSSEDVEYGTIEQGTYEFTTKANSDTRIRTSDKFRLIPGNKYVFSCNSGYLVNVNEANKDGSYAGEYFGPEKTIEFIATAPFAVMVIRKDDGSEISPSDFSAVGLTAKVYPIENDEVVGKSGTEKLVYELCGNLWLGKKANFLGDSITAGHIIGSQYSWIETCKKVLGLSVARNYGISASTIAAGYQPFSDRYADMDNDADLIVVLGSRNDFGTNVPIGSSADEDNTTFYGAMKILAEGLWAKYPTKTVVFCTQFKAMKQRDGYIERDSNPNSAGNNQEAYNEVIREVCKAHAFPVIDLYYDGVFNSWNDGMRSAFFIDTVHPNIEGDVFLGEKIASRLKMI